MSSGPSFPISVLLFMLTFMVTLLTPCRSDVLPLTSHVKEKFFVTFTKREAFVRSPRSFAASISTLLSIAILSMLTPFAAKIMQSGNCFLVLPKNLQSVTSSLPSQSRQSLQVPLFFVPCYSGTHTPEFGLFYTDIALDGIPQARRACQCCLSLIHCPDSFHSGLALLRSLIADGTLPHCHWLKSVGGILILGEYIYI